METLRQEDIHMGVFETRNHADESMRVRARSLPSTSCGFHRETIALHN